MLKRFLSYYSPYKRLFILDMGAAVLGSLLSILFPQLTRELLRTYIPNHNWSMLMTVFGIMLGIYVVQTLCTYIRVRWGHQLGVFMESDMRQDLFGHLQRLSFRYFDKTKTGHLMSRITNDLFMITETAHHGPEDLLISIVVIIGAYAVMFMNNVPLALVSIIPLPIMLFFGVHYGRKLKAGFREVRSTVADVNSVVENSIQGVREVQSFTSEGYEKQKFKQVNTIFQNARSNQYRVMARYESTMLLFRELYYFTTVAGGAVLIYLGKVPVYDLVAFILYVGVVLPPIDRLIHFTEQLQQGMAAFERFVEVMDIQSDINDRPDAVDLNVTEGAIRFDHVHFRYGSDGETVLAGIDIEITGGSTVAIVGESGAGKSTLVSLVPRFYEPVEGRILIDGQDIGKVKKASLRKQIGFVQQNVFLFDGTIRENLKYGKGDATDEEMYDALEKANLSTFIRSLPSGLDTEVGERGTRLSGGQKQRISIARVFLKNPRLLIFDEATSSLDTESEYQIQDAFKRLASGRTAIVIAHRLTTVRDADIIYVLADGAIVESGDHDSLIAANGQYAKLYRNQELR
ncbi:MAG TPA: thiamine ABC transporter permease [Sphaerochaeta sp.]|nr:MAG: thiamine ABC transporter permease [Spirochaetes bacterium GWC2_52_13]OHD67673.1 MAG: thiamine ABC transporter permease [Spirochaetes bacterium GWF2_52_7]PKL12086.1 MAG: thiamine ABC transporter permease [Spirochaetae bacterium HGW-Spirochaetae-8]PKL20856.1 MAG: thiamine ABC transporter permease [Spirochaetae bacterium HGW-Spirochaetae-4]HCJ94985.1 thiamine ABC transporter permease [Sphaerochaeta sp.]